MPSWLGTTSWSRLLPCRLPPSARWRPPVVDMFDLDKHVDTIRECYKKRRAVMLGDSGQRSCLSPAPLPRPEGGLFAWVVLPEYMDAKELQMKCLEKKVAFVPGGSFFPQRRPREHPAPELLLHARGEDRSGHHRSVPDHPRESALIHTINGIRRRLGFSRPAPSFKAETPLGSPLSHEIQI